MPESKLYVDYRALGYYTNHIPIQILYHERLKESFIVTSVGKSYHIYNASKLGISRVSNVHEEEINCLAASGNRIYVGVKNEVFSHERNKQDILKFTKHAKSIHTLLPFGKHLLSIDNDSTVIVWAIETQEPYLEMPFNNEIFEISSAVHPATYINKILFGSIQGSLQLWNIKTNKMIYEFSGWGHGVTIMKQAPAIDVIGIGLSNGDILVHNIKFDETVMRFKQEWGAVTGLTFRTDGVPIMITGSTQGHLAVWNLSEKRLSSQMRDAHQASVTGLECLSNEPVMVTSSRDNNLKVWIFDCSDGGARLLHRRQGHAAPVSSIRFHDETTMLSASLDCTMCVFSTEHDRHTKPLGRAVWNKNAEVKRIMPPFSQVANQPRRSSDWDDILAVHNNNPTVTLWSSRKGTLTEHLAPRKQSTALCCTISPCGNFGFIGYQDGQIEMFNMQSKISRGSFANGHTGAVRCVACDGLSQVLVSAGADSKVILWHIKSHKQLVSIAITSSVDKIKVHEESSMVAVALDNFSILIIDLETKRIVRKFPGHEGRITDLTFNPSGKWLISSSMDCTVCTWDLLTGSLIDKVTVDQAVTSLDMSPRGEFLAVAILDEPGVFIWSNKTLYSHVPLKALSLEGEELSDLRDDFKTSDQIADELVTLSLLPESRWANLLRLDIIKYRNRIRAPPKIQKAAPFFLPTIPGLVPQFAIPEKEPETDGKREIKFNSSTGVDRLLLECIESNLSEPFVEHMKKLGVASIESEIRCLAPEEGDEPDLLLAFLKVIKLSLQSHKDFELVQAYLALFLKVHNELIMSSMDLLEELEQVQEASQSSWQKLDNLFNKSLCLVTYQRSAIL